MAPIDAIWLVLVKTYPLPATSWLPTHPPSSHSIGVLLVLVTPVKKTTVYLEFFMVCKFHGFRG